MPPVCESVSDSIEHSTGSGICMLPARLLNRAQPVVIWLAWCRPAGVKQGADIRDGLLQRGWCKVGKKPAQAVDRHVEMSQLRTLVCNSERQGFPIAFCGDRRCQLGQFSQSDGAAAPQV